MTLNGTFWTEAEITSSQCVNFYLNDFRDSFDKAVTAAEDAIRRHEMCLQTTNIQLLAGAISILTHTNTGKLEFNVAVSPTNQMTFADTELCALDVSLFVENFINWRQPIIAGITDCEQPTFNPQYFTQKDAKWKCF